MKIGNAVLIFVRERLKPHIFLLTTTRDTINPKTVEEYTISAGRLATLNLNACNSCTITVV